jgi:cyclase
MKIFDLSTPVDASKWEPETVVHEITTPAEGAAHMAEEMSANFGLEVSPSDLRDSELLSIDTLTLTTHTGTHIDAPSHYGTRTTYGSGTPRNIDEMPLDWFYGPGVVLDISEAEHVADAAFLERELKRIDYTISPGDIVLLYTGAAQFAGSMLSFTNFVGLDASGTNFLLDQGVKVIGTDAFSLDAPFGDMISRFNETEDNSVLFPAHFVGRDREYCQIERLNNLDDLPEPYGFTVACFPIKIVGAGAGWSRAVALVPEDDK